MLKLSQYRAPGVINICLIANGQQYFGGLPTIPYGASCYLTFTAINDSDVSDDFIIQTYVSRQDGSLAFSDNRRTGLLQPGSTRELGLVGPFTADEPGLWSVYIETQNSGGSTLNTQTGNLMIVAAPSGDTFPIDLSSIMAMMMVVMMMGMIMPMIKPPEKKPSKEEISEGS